jgi:hypothetical protein
MSPARVSLADINSVHCSQPLEEPRQQLEVRPLRLPSCQSLWSLDRPLVSVVTAAVPSFLLPPKTRPMGEQIRTQYIYDMAGCRLRLPR